MHVSPENEVVVDGFETGVLGHGVDPGDGVGNEG